MRFTIAATPCSGLGGAEEARESFAAAVALDPRRADFLNNLSLALIGLELARRGAGEPRSRFGNRTRSCRRAP